MENIGIMLSNGLPPISAERQKELETTPGQGKIQVQHRVLFYLKSVLVLLDLIFIQMSERIREMIVLGKQPPTAV